MSDLQAILTDTNGVAWNIMTGPVRLAAAGITGLGLPDFDEQLRQYANQDGQELKSWSLKARTVGIPFRFKGAAARDVEGLQRQFWDGLAIGQFSTLLVRDKSGAERTLRIRIKDDGGIAYKYDPYLQQPDAYGLSFVADKPWWLGPAIPFSYALNPASQTDSFFGGGDGSAKGPPFYISPSQGAASQVMTNPGAVTAWPIWTLQGPLSSFDLIVNGHHITADVTLNAGDTLVINADPTMQSATLNGTRLALRTFRALDFAPIPKGVNVPVTISTVGAGLVTASIVPKYARAF